MGNMNSFSNREQKIKFLQEHPELWVGVKFDRRNAPRSLHWRRLYKALVEAGLVSERTNHVDINIPRLINEVRLRNGEVT
jgi:hypothetical protein